MLAFTQNVHIGATEVEGELEDAINPKIRFLYTLNFWHN